jgi:DNA-directed RNA polymerase specialized sigma subunit
MPVAMQISWQEFLETYNRMHKANFKTPQAMVAALYAREGTLIKVADILGISDNSVSLFMMKHGLPRLPRGHRGNSALQVAYRKIENPGQYKHRELAKMIGCSTGYVSNLVKRHTK